VVFCGLNPAASAAAAGHNFSSRSNGFWMVLHRAGFTDVPLRAHEERRLLDYGCGITAVVGRPTWRADEVSLEEFKAARAEFKAKIRRYAPRSIAFLGKRALSAMIGQPVRDWGRLPKEFAGTTARILPSPSGLNRNFTLDGLVAAYTEFRTILFGDAQARTPLESVSKVPVVNRRQPGTAFKTDKSRSALAAATAQSAPMADLRRGRGLARFAGEQLLQSPLSPPATENSAGPPNGLDTCATSSSVLERKSLRRRDVLALW
jgi:double-stranded uracil-DNA glycosylase